MDKYIKLSDEMSFSDEVQKGYNLLKERAQNANYKRDLEIARLKTISMNHTGN